jgi:hypothetical protein
VIAPHSINDNFQDLYLPAGGSCDPVYFTDKRPTIPVVYLSAPFEHQQPGSPYSARKKDKPGVKEQVFCIADKKLNSVPLF